MTIWKYDNQDWQFADDKLDLWAWLDENDDENAAWQAMCDDHKNWLTENPTADTLDNPFNAVGTAIFSRWREYAQATEVL